MASIGRQDVVLGLAGDLIVDGERLSQKQSKAGGRPIIAGSSPPFESSDIVCRVCRGVLSLVVQVHLPQYTDEDVVLYVFGCTHEGCGQQDGSWRAFSQHMRSPVAEPSTCEAPASSALKDRSSYVEPNGTLQLLWDAVDPPESVGQNSASGMPGSSDDWGSEQSQAGDFGSARADADSSLSLEELSAALEGLATSSRRGAQTSATKKTAGKKEKQPHPEEATCILDGLPSLPEFHLVLGPEPNPDGQLKSSEQEHIESLLKQYQTEEGNPQIKEASPGQGLGGWGGEGYEKPSAASADLAFHQYAKRMQRQPEQCIRIAHGGLLLWPKEQHPQLDRCSCCKKLILEAQLMAPLMHMFSEAGEWLADGCAGPSRASGFVDAPLSWEWLTIGVLTCEKGCRAREAHAGTVEETVVIANE